MTKSVHQRLLTLLICGLLAMPLAVQAEPSSASGKHLVVTEEALQVWFKEQDQLLDEILVRLSRIETLVADIHQLLTRLPDYGQLPVTPAPVLKRAPAAETEPSFLENWMQPLAGAGLLALLLLGWSRRRSAAPVPLPPPVAMPAPAVVVAPVIAVPQASPRSAAAPTRPPPPASQSDQALELAEIMLSMGLGSGAAQTLAEQIHNEPKQALRHWLKLLEIYRKNGQQEEFERSAEELRQHFNVQPEDWKAANDTYRGLESFPHIAQRLVDLWRTPDCLVYMQNLLDDNRDGARAGFPQAVAEELLILTGILKFADG